jgi:hypothetical protein
MDRGKRAMVRAEVRTAAGLRRMAYPPNRSPDTKKPPAKPRGRVHIREFVQRTEDPARLAEMRQETGRPARSVEALELQRCGRS